MRERCVGVWGTVAGRPRRSDYGDLVIKRLKSDIWTDRPWIKGASISLIVVPEAVRVVRECRLELGFNFIWRCT